MMAPTGEYFISSLLEKIYFINFASYYVSDFFWIRTTSDIKMLVFHHTITLFLIFSCAVVARPVLGMSIMVLHDWGDAFLYMGKIATYLQKQKWADFSFYTFAILFFYFRIFGLATVIWAMFKEPNNQTHHVKLYRAAETAVGFLYCCHIIWAYQILRVVYKILNKTSNPHDSRSDEGEKPKEN